MVVVKSLAASWKRCTVNISHLDQGSHFLQCSWKLRWC